MEKRKEKEIAHYDKLAEKWQNQHLNKNLQVDIEDYDVNIFSSYRFCKKWIKNNIKPGIKFLDYGCGHGMYSVLPAKLGAEVYAIDLSGESLKIAEQRIKKQKCGNIKFIKMDCEFLKFPDNYFDLIWNSGTFSSLDIKRAFPELSRVLKPNGKLIGVETFGHNPLTNFKRWINKKRGIRTSWATEHIIKNKNLKFAKEYFNIEKIYYFHLLSMLAFPFRNISGGKTLFKFLDQIDHILLKILWLKRYAFKIVFIFSKK